MVESPSSNISLSHGSEDVPSLTSRGVDYVLLALI